MSDPLDPIEIPVFLFILSSSEIPSARQLQNRCDKRHQIWKTADKNTSAKNVLLVVFVIIVVVDVVVIPCLSENDSQGAYVCADRLSKWRTNWYTCPLIKTTSTSPLTKTKITTKASSGQQQQWPPNIADWPSILRPRRFSRQDVVLLSTPSALPPNPSVNGKMQTPSVWCDDFVKPRFHKTERVVNIWTKLIVSEAKGITMNWTKF